MILPAVLGGAGGAIIGSFLATLILRWPAGRSVVKGRSACDGCGRTLAPVELVPILSAILQRGTCRGCGARIDPLHARVELACAAIGGLSLALMPDIAGVGWAVLGWLLLTLAILDWRHFWLPDRLTLPLAFLGLTLGSWVTGVLPVDRAAGAAIGYLALLAIALSYRALRKREGLGLGDAKLLGGLGGWFGWQALPFLLLTASLIALLTVLARRPFDATGRIPLGTFLCVAALPGWMLTQRLLGL